MISESRDMFAVCAVALLCLASVSFSAPLSCEDLVRPLDRLEPHHFEDRSLVANSPVEEFLKRRESARIHFSISSNLSSVISYHARFDGQCHEISYNISVNGSSIIIDGQANHTMTALYTSCPDCMLIHFNRSSGTSLEAYLFSRRREVDQKEIEEFKAQLKCLKMPPPAVMDPTKELCPDQTITKPAGAQTEEKTKEQKD